MKVKKRTLLLIACLVWSTAGANILRIGIITFPLYLCSISFCPPLFFCCLTG